MSLPRVPIALLRHIAAIRAAHRGSAYSTLSGLSIAGALAYVASTDEVACDGNATSRSSAPIRPLPGSGADESQSRRQLREALDSGYLAGITVRYKNAKTCQATARSPVFTCVCNGQTVPSDASALRRTTSPDSTLHLQAVGGLAIVTILLLAWRTEAKSSRVRYHVRACRSYDSAMVSCATVDWEQYLIPLRFPPDTDAHVAGVRIRGAR